MNDETAPSTPGGIKGARDAKIQRMGKQRHDTFTSWIDANAKYVFLVLLAVAAMSLAAIAMGNARSSAASNGEQRPLATFGAEQTANPIAPISAPAGAKVLIFGDSWTAGYAASPSDQGYAYLTANQLGWNATVDGVSGTGYVNSGPNGEGTYADRVAALPADLAPSVVIVQGGINDAFQPASAVRTAIGDTLDAIEQRFPDATIVVLGPAPATLPVESGLKSVDDALRSAALSRSLNYISPIADEWISQANYAEVIDVNAANHPSTAGHAFLAQRTVDALRAISG